MHSLIQLDGIEKKYSIDEQEIKVINGISLSINKGEFISFMGPSGSGKSTLLNLIASLDNINCGSIIVDGIEINNLNNSEKADYRKEKVSFVFQDYNLVSSLSVGENILLPLLLKKQSGDVELEEISKKLNIDGILHKYPFEISGGQQQRCACARAIISNKPILLADEPTGALDSVSRKQLMSIFKELNRNYKLTIVMVTHDVFTACYSDKVFFINDGKIKKTLLKDRMNDKAFFRKLLEQVEDMEVGTDEEEYSN